MGIGRIDEQCMKDGVQRVKRKVGRREGTFEVIT